MDIVSLLVMSAAGAAATYGAAGHGSGTLRLPIMQGKDIWWNDWRLAIGAVAAIGLVATDPKSGWRLLWGILGGAALVSYASTEVMRMVVARRLGGWGALEGGSAANQLPQAQQGALPQAVSPVQAEAVPAASGLVSGYW